MNEKTRTRILDLAVQIQQIPAPTFDESLRAAFVTKLFKAAGLKVRTDELHNVYAFLPGKGEGRPLVVSAHLDTVFPAGTDLTVTKKKGRIYGPGIGDNSLGVAGLFGLLWALQEEKIELPAGLWLVANVGEEGLGDLNGMRAVVDHFGAEVLAYIILEGMAYGRIYHQGLGVRRYRISAKTAGGHSWVDYGAPSAIHALAQLVTQLVELRLPKEPRTTLNVGVIQGGTSVNTIAPQASLELDLRSVSAEGLDLVANKVLKMVEAAQTDDLQFTAEVIGDRPVGTLDKSHALIKLARDAISKQGDKPELNVGSTDANIPLNCGYPAVCIGLSNGGGAHTTSEFVETKPLKRGMAQLLAIVKDAYSLAHE